VLLASVVFIPAAMATAEKAIVHVIPTRKLGYLDMRFRQLMLDEYVVARHCNVRNRRKD